MQYIHESFQLVPGAIPEFTDSFRDRYLPLMTEGGARLVGIWEPVAISLPWSRAVMLWEIDGPAEYQGLVRWLHTKEERRLRDWQSSLRGISTGGEGRLLEAPEEAPSLAELKSRGVDLDVIVHETITTPAGSAGRLREGTSSRNGYLPARSSDASGSEPISRSGETARPSASGRCRIRPCRFRGAASRSARCSRAS